MWMYLKIKEKNYIKNNKIFISIVNIYLLKKYF